MSAASAGPRGWVLLALSVLVGVVWILSGAYAAAYRAPRWSFIVGLGSVSVHTSESPLPLGPKNPPGWSSGRFSEYQWPWQQEWWPVVGSQRGMMYTGATGGVNTETHWLCLWAVGLVLLGLSAATFLSGVVARRRALKGVCVKCGYSLAGLASGSACPECGRRAAGDAAR